MHTSVRKFSGKSPRIITGKGKSTSKPLFTQNAASPQEANRHEHQQANWFLLREMSNEVFQQLVIYTAAPFFFSQEPPSLDAIRQVILQEFPHKLKGGELLVADPTFEIPERILLESADGTIIFTLTELESAVTKLVGQPTYTVAN